MRQRSAFIGRVALALGLATCRAQTVATPFSGDASLTMVPHMTAQVGAGSTCDGLVLPRELQKDASIRIARALNICELMAWA